MSQYRLRLRRGTAEVVTAGPRNCYDGASALLQAYELILEALRDQELRAAHADCFADAVDEGGEVRFSVPFSSVVSYSSETDAVEARPIAQHGELGQRGVIKLASVHRQRQIHPCRLGPTRMSSAGKVFNLPVG